MLANTLKVSLSTIDRKLNEFPHIKLGDTRQSRVLFETDEEKAIKLRQRGMTT